MAEIQKYPIGIQNFVEIIRDGWTYIDKTDYIRILVSSGKYFFLGRPRRFGKSLFLSTMHAFFEGRRDLFRGLAIDSWTEWDWKKYPVIHIDLNAQNYTEDNALQIRVSRQLTDLAEHYAIEDAPHSNISDRFYNLIVRTSKKTEMPVVVLIDEYDKPILDTMHDPELEDMHRDLMRGFYSVLKSADQYIKLGFLTGITKFGQLNIFSGLNNIEDISLSKEFAGICGITEEELHQHFETGVNDCARQWNVSVDKAYEYLKIIYDGYHFSEDSPDIYNPWSLLNAIKKKTIGEYWNASGGNASFLYKLIKNQRFDVKDLSGYECTGEELYGTTASQASSVAMLYQTGYLTIKEAQRNGPELIYTLGYPNREVERGFLEGLLEMSADMPGMATPFSILQFVKDLRQGDLKSFLTRISSLFAGITYRSVGDRERHFQTVMYCLTALLGMRVSLESYTSDGNIDMLIETDRYVYIMEFKIDQSARKALEQIREKRYGLKFAADPRQLIYAGISFSTKKRCIDDFIIEQLK